LGLILQGTGDRRGAKMQVRVDSQTGGHATWEFIKDMRTPMVLTALRSIKKYCGLLLKESKRFVLTIDNEEVSTRYSKELEEKIIEFISSGDVKSLAPGVLKNSLRSLQYDGVNGAYCTSDFCLRVFEDPSLDYFFPIKKQLRKVPYFVTSQGYLPRTGRALIHEGTISWDSVRHLLEGPIWGEVPGEFMSLVISWVKNGKRLGLKSPKFIALSTGDVYFEGTVRDEEFRLPRKVEGVVKLFLTEKNLLAELFEQEDL
jgi:hypothetical protein